MFKRKKIVAILIPALIVISILLMPTSMSTLDTSLSVNPGTKTVARNESFMINITLTNVTDLYSWDLKLSYNSSILNCSDYDIHIPTEWGSNYYILTNKTGINNTIGMYRVVVTAQNPAPPFNGSHSLVSLTFKAIGVGETNLDLYDTKLGDYSGPNPIDHTVSNGTVTVLPIHDVSVTGIWHSISSVKRGHSVNINVTVENQGDFDETFDVIAYADLDWAITGDEITIGTQSVNLSIGNSTIVSFTWDTTGVTLGMYMLSAYATPVPSETNTDDNTYEDGVVNVYKPSIISGGWEKPPMVCK